VTSLGKAPMQWNLRFRLRTTLQTVLVAALELEIFVVSSVSALGNFSPGPKKHLGMPTNKYLKYSVAQCKFVASANQSIKAQVASERSDTETTQLVCSTASKRRIR